MRLLQCYMLTALLYCGIMMVVTGDEAVEVEENDGQESLNFYSFPVMDIMGNIVSLEEYIGKVSLVVNVASQCGYTDGHYKMLTLLQKLFDETNKFNVLAFPCNQFGGQEPGTPHEIVDFAYNTMGANFELFAKVNIVKQDVNAAWDYLIKESGQIPTWNFWKYLVDHNGHVINAWGPSVSPDQLYPNIEGAIKKANKAEEENKKESSSDNSEKRKKDEF